MEFLVLCMRRLQEKKSTEYTTQSGINTVDFAVVPAVSHSLCGLVVVIPFIIPPWWNFLDNVSVFEHWTREGKVARMIIHKPSNIEHFENLNHWEVHMAYDASFWVRTGPRLMLDNHGAMAKHTTINHWDCR